MNPSTWRLRLLLPVFLLLLAATAACSQPVIPTPAPATPLLEPANSPTALPTAIPTTTPTATPAPTATPVPTATPAPTATHTPVPVLRQLTSGGCCTQPFWSPDSTEVRYIDKPGPAEPVGYWSVDAGQTLPEPKLRPEPIAYYSSDFSHRLELGAQTTIVRMSDGAKSVAPAGGRVVSFSPGRKRIAWSVSPANVPVERRVTQVWVANIDGTNARQVISLPRGGLAGWVSDDVVLLTAADSLQSRSTRLISLDLTNDQRLDPSGLGAQEYLGPSGRSLADEQRLRGLSVSPDGKWLVYFITQNEDKTKNGLYLARSDGTSTRLLDRELFGAYQWRDGNRLLIIPFQTDAPSHAVWELDASTNEVRPLTQPEVTPFKIANGEWRVAPDGHTIVFVSAADRNLWVLELPG